MSARFSPLAPGTPLCALSALEPTGAKGLLVGEGPARLDLFVVRARGGVKAYRNTCPHRGTPLETFEDRFLDAAGREIVCTTHGARFRAEDGLCLSGPCRGKSLEAIPVRVENKIIVAG